VDIIEHHFGLLRYEFNVICTNPEPFIILFSDRAARDLVFARDRVIDGPVQLRFHQWDVDHFGERSIVPFHVKLSLKGLPHHAWFREIAEKVVGSDAVIHHVEQGIRRRSDMRFYVCWAFSQNPSRKSFFSPCLTDLVTQSVAKSFVSSST
jgi:hypothetical protein